MFILVVSFLACILNRQFVELVGDDRRKREKMSYLSCPLRTVSVVRYANLTEFRSENCVCGLLKAGPKICLREVQSPNQLGFFSF